MTTDQQIKPEDADAYLRGFIAGHEQGIAASEAFQAMVKQLQAAAWEAGYDVGHRDGIAEAREDTAQIIADLAASSAAIDAAWKHFSQTTREQRIAAEVAEMKTHAEKLHAQAGTTEWAGLDNGAVLPSADWEPSPASLTALADKANKARTLAPNPVLTNWPDVSRYVSDDVWERILDDLQPGPRGQRTVAIRQTGRTYRYRSGQPALRLVSGGVA